MKFSLAWADIASQNISLKVSILLLSITAITLGICTVILSMREPLIIERSCYSNIIKTASPSRQAGEIEAFIKIALAQRFDLAIPTDGDLLSDDEKSFKRQEQKDFESKGMTQKVVVNSVKIDGSKVTIDADRLISWGQIRSALVFPLVVTISSVDRNQGNPYGLRIMKISSNSKPTDNK